MNAAAAVAVSASSPACAPASSTAEGAAYGLHCTLSGIGFAEAVARVTAALKTEGFGVLTDIDVQATMKAKLDLAVRPYRILGACNPQFASRAIAAEPSIGALLPCNVVVRQDAAGAVHIELMDPNAVLTLVDHPDVGAMAAEVRQKLAQALAAV